MSDTFKFLPPLSHEVTDFAFKALSEGTALPEVARLMNEEWVAAT